jgi:hypothetical protein
MFSRGEVVRYAIQSAVAGDVELNHRVRRGEDGNERLLRPASRGIEAHPQNLAPGLVDHDRDALPVGRDAPGHHPGHAGRDWLRFAADLSARLVNRHAPQVGTSSSIAQEEE